MSRYVTLDQPQAQVLRRSYGWVLQVWRHELETAGGRIKLATTIGIFMFRWSADRARRKWLRDNAEEASRG